MRVTQRSAALCHAPPRPAPRPPALPLYRCTSTCTCATAPPRAAVPSRRDDVEAVAYVLLHLRGTAGGGPGLPWACARSTEEGHRIKAATPLAELCADAPGKLIGGVITGTSLLF